MELGILGPLTISRDGAPAVLPRGKRQRALFLCLLLRRNETVSVDALVEAVWPGDRPATAPKIVQVYVSQWRKVVGDRIETRSPGYVLHVEDGELDSARAQVLAVRAREAAPAEALPLLDEALALWRGESLADVRYEPFAQAEVARLDELKVTLAEHRAEAGLELGRHAALVPELEALVASHPLSERFRAQLMLALYRSGRQADALRVYGDARRALVDELGLEPGDELQRLQRSILEHDGSVKAPSPPFVERGLRRPRRLALAGGVLLAGAITAAALELTRGGSAAIAVQPNSVVVIDPASNRVVADIPVGSRPVAVAVGDKGVWVANADDGTVSHIDPRTRRVVKTIGIGGEVSDIAVGSGAVWVANGNDGTLTRIDPRLDAVQAILDLGGRSALVPQPVFMVATGQGKVWATSGTRIVEIDPATNEIVRTVQLGSTLFALTVGEGAVWVSTITERLLRIEPRTGSVTATIPLPAPAFELVAGGGTLWTVIAIRRGEIWSFDPRTATPMGTVVVGDLPKALSPTPEALWVVSGGDGTVARVDPQSDELTAKVAIGQGPDDVAAGDGLVWVSVASPSPT